MVILTAFFIWVFCGGFEVFVGKCRCLAILLMGLVAYNFYTKCMSKKIINSVYFENIKILLFFHHTL